VLQTIVNLGKKARDSTLSIDDMSGGTFTISNGGVYGSLLSTPIINPPQSAILGMHSIQPRPMVIDGDIKARPMMYIALTYDHRLIDGREVSRNLRLLQSR
jgi:2-oxoglutarate dehydrogenase E2 component (dihydrolipoamide succinyltransferase)